MSGWDTIGLLFGERVYMSPSYDVLREVASGFKIGGFSIGIRVYGGILLVITSVVAWALLHQRYRDGRMTRRLRLGLSALAGYWVAWCFGVVMTFVVNAQVYSWGAIGKLVGIAAIAVLAARVPPPKATTQQTGRVKRAVGPVPVDPRPDGAGGPPHPAAGT
ncbi:hypothetical protein [Actinoplanes sp. URMC 104]|uniref:hypothetical protein n=1 Tax=Actinoplanes sp. URMC 104 TaxID=3423409 RepID=UPI003F1DBAF7